MSTGRTLRLDVATLDNCQAYADTALSHDWLSVHAFAKASEVRSSTW